MRGQFGKVNTMHTHVLPWTDRPLVTRNLVGGDEGISDSGISVSRLIPNRLHVPRGDRRGVRRATRASSQAASAPTSPTSAALRGYRDLTEGTNLDLGASFAFGHTARSCPMRRRRLFGVDATFRYRPLRRAIYRRFLARTELVWSQPRERSQPRRPCSGCTRAASTSSRGAGLPAAATTARSARWTRPWWTRVASLSLTFWPSEFSQVRGQYRRTRYAEGVTANEFLFQFLFSIGAHGAHVFYGRRSVRARATLGSAFRVPGWFQVLGRSVPRDPPRTSASRVGTPNHWNPEPGTWDRNTFQRCM